MSSGFTGRWRMTAKHQEGLRAGGRAAPVSEDSLAESDHELLRASRWHSQPANAVSHQGPEQLIEVTTDGITNPGPGHGGNNVVPVCAASRFSPRFGPENGVM